LNIYLAPLLVNCRISKSEYKIDFGDRRRYVNALAYADDLISTGDWEEKDAELREQVQRLMGLSQATVVMRSLGIGPKEAMKALARLLPLKNSTTLANYGRRISRTSTGIRPSYRLGRPEVLPTRMPL
jgi:hypothetical protein